MVTSPGSSASLFILGRFYTPFIDDHPIAPNAVHKHGDHTYLPFKFVGFFAQ